MREYQLINGENNTYKIKFIHPPYDNIIFSFSRVELLDKEDHAVLSFDYEVHEGVVDNKDDFVTELGDLLTDMIEENLTKGQMVYTGGTD